MKEPGNWNLPNRVQKLLQQALIAKAEEIKLIDAADIQAADLLNFNPLVRIAESLQQARAMLEQLHEMKMSDPEDAQAVEESKQMMERQIRLLQQEWHDEFDNRYPASN